MTLETAFSMSLRLLETVIFLNFLLKWITYPAWKRQSHRWIQSRHRWLSPIQLTTRSFHFSRSRNFQKNSKKILSNTFLTHKYKLSLWQTGEKEIDGKCKLFFWRSSKTRYFFFLYWNCVKLYFEEFWMTS